MKTIERQVLRDIFKSIDKRQGAIVLNGPLGIGKSTLITQTTSELRGKGFEFIVVRGCTTVEQILEAIAMKAESMGVGYAEKFFNAFDEPVEKLAWYLDRFLLKQKAVIIFHHFEENQDEKKAGEFKQERLKKFLWVFKDRLTHHETFLLFSTRYPLPGFDAPGMTKNIPGFSAPEFRKMLMNSKTLKQLDEKSLETLWKDLGGNPLALELLDRVAHQEYKQRDFTWKQLKELILKTRQQSVHRETGQDEFIPLFLEILSGYLDKTQHKMLDVLAVYGNPVPEEALAAQHAVIEEEDRAKLADLSLLQCIESEEKELYCVHGLTARYRLETMKETEKKKYHRRAARYFEAIPEEEGKVYLHYRIEARRHYLRAREWNRAAQLTIDLTPYLMDRGYLLFAVELLRELEMKKLSEKNRAEVHNCLGDIHKEFGEHEQALSQYTRALEIAKKINDLKCTARYMYQMGIIYYKKGDYDPAFNHYSHALETSDKIGDNKGMADSLHQLGNIYQFKGDYDTALNNVKKSLEIKEKIGDTLGIAKSLLLIGMFYYNKRDYDAASASFQESKEEYGKIAHYRGVKGVAAAWHWLGMVYQARGDYDAALDHFQKSNEEFDKIADFKDMCYNFYRIGMIYNDKGDYDAALHNLHKAKEVFEKNRDSKNVSNSLHEMGKVYQNKGDYEAALTAFRKSMEMSEKIGHIKGSADNLARIGTLYFRQDEYETALEYFLRAFRHFTDIGGPNVNLVREDIARVRGNLPEEQFNSILQEFNLPTDFFDNDEEKEQEQFVEFLAALTRDAAAAKEKSSEEKEQLSARLNQFIGKLADTPEGRDLKSYFRLLLAVVNGKDYREYLEEISEGLKELFEAT